MKTLLLILCITLLSCSKEQTDCKRVELYMDSLSNGKVVSSYKGYDEKVCGEDLRGFKEGWSFYCDSFHVRRCEIK